MCRAGGRRWTVVGYSPWRTSHRRSKGFLQFAPFWLFSSLVGRAGHVNALERQALTRCLAAAARTEPGRLGSEVLDSLEVNSEELLEEFAVDTRSIAIGLCAVSDLLERAPDHEASQFRQMLVGGFGIELARELAPFGRDATAEDMGKLRLTAELLVP